MTNHMSKKTLFAGISLLFLTTCISGRTESISVPCFADNTLYEDGSGSLSGGLDTYFLVGKTGAGVGGDEFRSVRGVLKFDVASYIPSGSTITSATLRLTMTDDSTSMQIVTLYRLLKNWGEGTSGGTIGGSPATAGSATWLHTFYSTNSWTSAGSDYSTEPSADAFTVGVGTYTFNTAELVADIQTWLDHPSSNFGWMVKGGESYGASQFDSRENSTTENRPTLEVGFEPLPPTLNLRRMANADMKCSWESILGAVYQLEYAVNLKGSQSWVSLGTYTASNLAASVTDTNHAPAHRIYRVVRP
jgi:hypothetical protein